MSLKVPNGEIESIRGNRHHRVQPCLIDGLSYWLRHNTKKIKGAPQINWKSILTVLSNGVVNQASLATTIEGDFRKELKETLKKENEQLKQ